MKRYEGCTGVGGWFISHLGWFIVIGVILVVMLVATKCHAQKANVNNATERNISNNIRVIKSEPCGPTLLPNELQESQIIKNMRVGARGMGTYNVMVVDEDGKCYLRTFLTFRKEKEENLGAYWVGIERTLEGYSITVQLDKGKPKWQPEHISFKKELMKEGDLVPVCKIIVIKKHHVFGMGVGGTAELLKNHK